MKLLEYLIVGPREGGRKALALTIHPTWRCTPPGNIVLRGLAVSFSMSPSTVGEYPELVVAF